VGLAFRVQEILQDGGLFTGDIVVIVLYFIGKRSTLTRYEWGNTWRN
jgi:hypothetical protein